MAATNSLLFNWRNVDELPDLDRLKLVLDHLPDRELIEELERRRGNGRNDFPVQAMWRLHIAGIVFQHPSTESLLREANRNPKLLEICGFEALPRQSAPEYSIGRDPETGRCHAEVRHAECRSTVPSSWNMSRFRAGLKAVEAESGLVSGVVARLRHELMGEVDDFGVRIGYDGKAVKSHSSGRKDCAGGKASDPDAAWGVHEYKWTDGRTGEPRSKKKTWFGYRMHVIADSRHETPLAVKVTPASVGESPALHAMLTEIFDEQSPHLADRARFFSADRGLDEARLRERLFDDYGIVPVIDNCRRWRIEKKEGGYDPKARVTRPLYPDRADNIVYDEAGRLYCHEPQSAQSDIDAKPATVRQMVYFGHDKQRGSLKFRCPAAVYDLECAGKAQCLENAGSKAERYGRTVRVPLQGSNRRIFKPIMKGSRTWKKEYSRRSALERVYSRVDQGYFMDRHYLRGLASMQLRANLTVAVMMAMALGRARTDRRSHMRSLIRPVEFRDAG